jgi:CIC family chloride channel protein
MRFSASQLLLQRARLRRLFHISEWQTMLFWATIAGLLGTAVTEAFRLLLHWVDLAVLGQGGGLVAIAQHLPPWARVAAPAVGGLVAGGLLMLASRFAQRQSRSDYMEAIVLGDGRIPVAQTMARSASSLVSIASGGSIGREGSMVQLAALCASLLGRVLRFPVERLRLLVACGAAAGLTAAYNAPIAGTFFVAEVVLGSIAMESLGPVLISAVVANVAMRALPGYEPAYAMPAFPTVAGAEVGLFMLLGVLVGGLAAVFLRALRGTRGMFARIALPLPLRLALGGLMVGLISLVLPEVWGNGYSVVNAVLHGEWAWKLLLLILVAKMVATLATVGAGTLFWLPAWGRLWPDRSSRMAWSDIRALRLRHCRYGRVPRRCYAGAAHGYPDDLRDDLELPGDAAPDGGQRRGLLHRALDPVGLDVRDHGVP